MKKAMSISMIVIGIASIPIYDGDITVAIFMALLGVGYLVAERTDENESL